MSAKDFLNLLEERGLLDPSIIADLRRQVDESTKGVSAETIAKLLVENEHLTRFQATKLVGEATKDIEARRSQRAEELESLNEPDPPAQSDEDDLLGELAQGPSLGKNDKSSPPPPPEEVVEVVEEVPVVEAVEPVQPVETVAPLNSLDDSLGGAGSDTPASTSTNPGYRKKTQRTNPWESPLMLVGSGALVLLALLAFLLWGVLTGSVATELFNKAMEDYQKVAYANAMDKFDKFIRRYPKHEYVSEARVRLNLCTLRLITDQMRSPEKALEKAEQILPEIKDETAFPKVREELASILPNIAEGFANQAGDATNTKEAERILGQVDEAMKLVQNPEYIPSSMLKTRTRQLERIAETVGLVRRGIDQERNLVSTVKKIGELVAAGSTREAYQIRDELLDEFPQLENDERLIEKVEAIGAAERNTVSVVAMKTKTADEAIPTPEQRVVLSGSRAAEEIRGAGAEVVFLAGGSLYGVDIKDGSLLWRRFVGFRTNFHPVPLQSAAGSDIIAVESVGNAVLRINPRTGDVVWRQVIGEEFNDPQIWRDRVVVSTNSGKVISVFAEDGSRGDYADLNQKLAVSPGVVPQRSVMYQVGENDNLYLLNQDTLVCSEVYYLAHRPGTVSVPPLAAFDHLFVFENAGPDFCNIHILKTDGQGGKLKQAQQPLRIVGHVVTTPIAERQRLIVNTDLGAIHIFDVDAMKNPPIAENITGQSASDTSPIVGHVHVDRADMWIARVGLAKMQILAAKAQMAPVWSGYPGDVFVSPVRVHNKNVFHLRKPFGAPGFTLGANDGSDPDKSYWTSDLAIPAAVLAMESASGQPMVFTRKGAFFRITDEAITSGYLTPVFADDQTNLTYTAGLQFGDKVALFSPAGRALVYDPERSSTELRSFRLNIPKEGAATPIAYQDGILAPLANGQVQLLDIDTGSAKAAPFQPSLRAGESVRWHRPTVVAGGRQFVIADHNKRVFRVAVQTSGRPRLVQAVETTLDDQIVTPLTELQNFVFAGARYDDSDVLLSMDAVSLKPRDVYRLSGRITWGPETAADRVLLSTSGDGLICFDSQQEVLWTAELSHGKPTGPPAVVDGDYLFATEQGAVIRVDGASGAIDGVVEVNEPLDGTPLPYKGKIAVMGSDGTLHLVESP